MLVYCRHCRHCSSSNSCSRQAGAGSIVHFKEPAIGAVPFTTSTSLRYSTYGQVIVIAASAGLQMKIREREEELAALAGSDGPVALSIRVVG